MDPVYGNAARDLTKDDEFYRWQDRELRRRLAAGERACHICGHLNCIMDHRS